MYKLLDTIMAGWLVVWFATSLLISVAGAEACNLQVLMYFCKIYGKMYALLLTLFFSKHIIVGLFIQVTRILHNNVYTHSLIHTSLHHTLNFFFLNLITKFTYIHV